MAKRDCNTLLTDSFSDSDSFVRVRNARVVCDADGKLLGSISEEKLFDLNGKEIAAFKAASVRTDNDENEIRVAEYASETRKFILEDDYLYTVENGAKRYAGQVMRKERNRVRIIVLSVLAALLIVTITLLAVINIPTSETVHPIINIRDNNGTWEAQGAVAVFGSDIKPGSEGEYGFVINNPHAMEMQYAFYLEPKYEGGDIDYFPLEFRLRMNNVLMETDEWLSVTDLKYEQLVILGGTTQAFTLEWRWPFEAGKDDQDTLLGVDNGKISLVLHLTAQARSANE